MGIAFVLLNPTILLPATWHEIALFATQNRIGHDGFEFMGKIYPHRHTDWLNGVPWYFFHLFLLIKLPVLTVAGFLVGLPLIFRRKLGDGRYFILIWLVFWMLTFSLGGGKFTRYFTTVLPAVLIVSALGVQTVGRWLGELLSALLAAEWPRVYLRPALAVIVVAGSLSTLPKAAPHFRLYTTALGGGMARAGYYFPHDEFYDASTRDVMFAIASQAKPGAQIASETPGLAAYYAERAGRTDLVCTMISDPAALQQLREGDFFVLARGRRYFSNELIIAALEQSSKPTLTFSLGAVPSTAVYVLDQKALDAIVSASRRQPPVARSSQLRQSRTD
jgi:hypothetical protein